MKTVLVVEDDKLLGKTVVKVLESASYKVIWAENGQDAWKTLDEGGVDFIYLDIMLPGDMDGYEILRRLRSPESNYQKTPVVMLSNLGQMSEVDRAMEGGATDYVIKANVDINHLVEVVDKLLK